MSKIIGVTVGTPISPQTLKEKLNPVLSVNGVKPDKNGNAEVTMNFEDLTEEQKASLKGEKGDPGVPGKDGYTPVKNVDYFDGKDGQPGADGEPGQDGYTPVKGVDYFDGAPGKDGQPGAPGKDGTNGKDGVSVTHSWNGTVLTITSASGTSSADLRGPQGPAGEGGGTVEPLLITVNEKYEITCPVEDVYVAFASSRPIYLYGEYLGPVTFALCVGLVDRTFVFTPYIAENGFFVFTLDTSTKVVNVLDVSAMLGAGISTTVNTALAEAKASGEFNGKDGKDGVDGKDGYTPVKGVDYFDGKDGAPGKDGSNGKDGADGKTPVKGTDYFTEADKAEMVASVIAQLPVYDGEVVAV